ncbi:MAG TPA: glycosyltransferase family 39 protein [Stellaceae bacterium]|nr:glycosyltransferase family 39 protein [Stellaceae bacterium]
MSLGELIRGWRAPALLVVLSLVLFLPGLAALPPTDRDEARFAQATRQMVETQDFVRIRFQDEARNKKPAGIHWLQAASVALFSDAESPAIWPYRVPSVLGALAAVLLTFGFGRAWVGREAAFLGAALLASALGLVVEAHLAKTDAVLLATVVAAQGALGEIYRRGLTGAEAPRGWALLFWCAQGAALLIKGPIALLASFLTAAALAFYERRWRWLLGLHFLWGVPLLLLMAGPWFLAIIFATEGAFVTEAGGGDLLAKLLRGQESHGAPPGTYLALVFLSFWPGSIALGMAARRAWHERKDDAIRFLIAWIVPFWIVMEAIPTKLPHYVLPTYPAIALLSARALLERSAGERWHWLEVLCVALWGLATLALAGGVIALPNYVLGGAMPVAVLGAAVTLVLAAQFLQSLRRQRMQPWLGIAAAAVLAGTGFGFVLPALDPIWLSRGVATLVARERLEGHPLLAVGYSEPSLVFLMGTATRLTTAEGAAELLGKIPSALVLVSDREDAVFRANLGKAGLNVAVVGEVSGINYSNGRHVTLRLYRGASP